MGVQNVPLEKLDGSIADIDLLIEYHHFAKFGGNPGNKLENKWAQSHLQQPLSHSPLVMGYYVLYA